jgi:transporter family-2 protein
MNQSIALALAVVGGAILPLQVLINSRLAVGLGNALWATTVSFIVGTVGMLAWLLVTRQASADWSQAASMPWWVWLGGLLGGAYVTFTIVTVPVLGATVLVLLLILGQMLAGTALDHFGILTQQQPVTLSKVAGLVLVFIGTVLVVRS